MVFCVQAHGREFKGRLRIRTAVRKSAVNAVAVAIDLGVD